MPIIKFYFSKLHRKNRTHQLQRKSQVFGKYHILVYITIGRSCWERYKKIIKISFLHINKRFAITYYYNTRLYAFKKCSFPRTLGKYLSTSRERSYIKPAKFSQAFRNVSYLGKSCIHMSYLNQ